MPIKSQIFYRFWFLFQWRAFRSTLEQIVDYFFFFDICQHNNMPLVVNGFVSDKFVFVRPTWLRDVQNYSPHINHDRRFDNVNSYVVDFQCWPTTCCVVATTTCCVVKKTTKSRKLDVDVIAIPTGVNIT